MQPLFDTSVFKAFKTGWHVTPSILTNIKILMSALNNFSLLDYLLTCRCYEKENSVIQRIHLSYTVRVQMETNAQQSNKSLLPYFFTTYVSHPCPACP